MQATAQAVGEMWGNLVAPKGRKKSALALVAQLSRVHVCPKGQLTLAWQFTNGNAGNVTVSRKDTRPQTSKDPSHMMFAGIG